MALCRSVFVFFVLSLSGASASFHRPAPRARSAASVAAAAQVGFLPAQPPTPAPAGMEGRLGAASLGEAADVEMFTGVVLPQSSAPSETTSRSVPQALTQDAIEEIEQSEVASMQMRMMQIEVDDLDVDAHGAHSNQASTLLVAPGISVGTSAALQTLMGGNAPDQERPQQTSQTWYGRVAALCATMAYFALIAVRCAGFLDDFAPRAQFTEMLAAPLIYSRRAEKDGQPRHTRRGETARRAASFLCCPERAKPATSSCGGLLPCVPGNSCGGPAVLPQDLAVI